MQSQGKKPKILDQVRSMMRRHHYSIHTEQTYIDWIKRNIAFHRMKSLRYLPNEECKIEAFLTLNQRRGFTPSAGVICYVFFSLFFQ